MGTVSVSEEVGLPDAVNVPVHVVEVSVVSVLCVPVAFVTATTFVPHPEAFKRTIIFDV